jgi:hypothetical protein
MAYSEVATIKKGVSGFSTTGIFPMNPGVFNDEDYLLAEILQDKANDHKEDEPEPSCSSTARRNKSSQLDVSIEDISPLPCRLPNVEIKKRTTKKQHSDILTRTPLKEQLLEKKRNMKKIKTKNY